MSERTSEWECLHSINSRTIKHHAISLVSVFHRINISLSSAVGSASANKRIFNFQVYFLELSSHWPYGLLSALFISRITNFCFPIPSLYTKPTPPLPITPQAFLLLISLWISSVLIHCTSLLNACPSLFPLVLCCSAHTPSPTHPAQRPTPPHPLPRQLSHRSIELRCDTLL